MAELQCSRCGNTAQGLDRAPLPGPAGEKIAAHTCVACWSDWMEAQIMVINEHGLSPAEPKHFEFLVAQMSAFLKLPAES